MLGLLRQTLALRLQEPSWPEIPVPDLEPVIEQASVTGSVLEPEAFTAIARMLGLTKRVQGLFRADARREAYPGLAALADRLTGDAEFARRIGRTFDPAGEVRDEASSELRSIRGRLRRRQQDVSQRLGGMSRSFRESGEDSFVTLRGGRYVLSVAAADQRRVRGIVHDRSATGKTVYVEPLDVIELNNSLAELEADERMEVHRILRELTSWVREHSADLSESQSALAALDELNARARLTEELGASMPHLDETGRRLRLVQARHPLLHMAAGREVVPLQLDLDDGRHALVVSGPNMGGKTVVLKTVGLLVLMAMAGLFVPAAEGTVVPWIDGVYVDIGDEQSLDFDLSTYAGHLRNMKAILGEAGECSLVLIDELGAGTDPDEGAALGVALLEEIGRRGTLCVTTTHLGAFKTFAADAPGFANAAMEHDPETLSPTYTLYVGLPGRSHAFELARREGWSSTVLDRARALMNQERVQTETLLAQIQAERTALGAERDQTARDRERLAASRERFEQLTAQLHEKMDRLKLEKALAEDRVFGELRRLMRDTKERIASLEAREKRLAAREARQSERMTGARPPRGGHHRGDGGDASAASSSAASSSAGSSSAGSSSAGSLSAGSQAAAPSAAEVRRWLHAREREVASLRRRREPAPLRVDQAGAAEAGRSLLAEEIVPGARAFARSLGVDVVIGETGGERDRVWVDHRGVRVRVPRADLETPREPGREGPREAFAGVRVPEESAEAMSEALRGELDLRGLDQQACEERLEQFLDRAVMAGVTRVRIIHGKGTGALRKRVLKVLDRLSAVVSHREGEPGEGGWGVTIAFLEKGAASSDSASR